MKSRLRVPKRKIHHRRKSLWWIFLYVSDFKYCTAEIKERLRTESETYPSLYFRRNRIFFNREIICAQHNNVCRRKRVNVSGNQSWSLAHRCLFDHRPCEAAVAEIVWPARSFVKRNQFGFHVIRKSQFILLSQKLGDGVQFLGVIIGKRHVKLNFRKLSVEERKWLKKIAEKSDLLKNPKPQRGRR